MEIPRGEKSAMSETSNFSITFLRFFWKSLQKNVKNVFSNYAGRYAVIGCKLKQNASEGCNSCASFAGLVLCFTACFILLVIAA